MYLPGVTQSLILSSAVVVFRLKLFKKFRKRIGISGMIGVAQRQKAVPEQPKGSALGLFDVSEDNDMLRIPMTEPRVCNFLLRYS